MANAPNPANMERLRVILSLVSNAETRKNPMSKAENINRLISTSRGEVNA